jgi:hypothetical protein
MVSFPNGDRARIRLFPADFRQIHAKRDGPSSPATSEELTIPAEFSSLPVSRRCKGSLRRQPIAVSQCPRSPRGG